MKRLINQVYKLIEPRKIQVSFENVDIRGGKVIVRPAYLSICAADQRYYMGLRPKAYLQQKLPMALIHEAAGTVVYDAQSEFSVGDSVVLIPNTPTVTDDYVSENYLETAKFRASGLDGFMQEYVAMDRDRLISCNGLDPVVACVCELLSVAMHAVTTCLAHAHGRRDTIGIWGDGNLAYMTALLLRHVCPGSRLVVTGIDPYKLGFFSFAHTVLAQDMPRDLTVDHAFECVGGQGAESAIEQIISHIRPEGVVMLLGVSERNVPLATRMVLEKGLHMIGRSRSGRQDFENVLAALRNDASLVSNISKILCRVMPVSNIKDISEAFEQDIKTPFKTIMQWNV